MLNPADRDSSRSAISRHQRGRAFALAILMDGFPIPENGYKPALARVANWARRRVTIFLRSPRRAFERGSVFGPPRGGAP
jgi:hypothetical protein